MAILPHYKDGLQMGLSSYTNALLLAANVPEIFTVPTDENGFLANYVTFGRGAATTDNFYAQVFNSADATDRAVNGTFASDTAWTKGADWTISGGVANCAGASNTDLSQVATTLPLINGQAYYCTFTMTRSAGSLALSLGGGTPGTTRSSAATFSEIIYAGSTQTILFDATGFTGTLDNVTIIPCAAVPGDTTTGTSPIQNPNGFYLGGNATAISIVSASTPIITASFFK